MTVNAHSSEVTDLSGAVLSTLGKMAGHELVRLDNGHFAHIAYTEKAFFESASPVVLLAAVVEAAEELGMTITEDALGRMYAKVLYDRYGADSGVQSRYML